VILIAALTGTMGLLLAKPDKAEPIQWKTATAKDFKTSEELKKRPIYDDWSKPSVSKLKPLIFYFYWPTEDKTSEDEKAKSRAEKTGKMDKVLDSNTARKAAESFECIKIDMRVLLQWGSKGEVLAAKYGIKDAPALAFFDRTGFPQGVFSGSTNEAVLAEKLKTIASIGTSSSGDWKTAEAMEFENEKALKKRSVFEDWTATRQLGEAKPIVLFFFWPVSDKKDKEAARDAKSQAEKTEQMETLLADGDVAKQLGRFYCIKVNVKELKSFGEPGETYLSKYRVRKAPVLVLYDFKGKKIQSVSGSTKASKLARILKSVADKSDRGK
jgi:thioredoxin-related protein